MKFIDSTVIEVRAGHGGDGIATFKSAKGAPKLGPDGGDGGQGGDVILRAEMGLNTLSSFRYKQIFRAEAGTRGQTKGCRGKSGEDLVIPMPLGTMIFDDESGELLGELVEEDQEILIAKGGHRGLGNMHWLTATHQAPQEFKPGGLGEAKVIRLELKLLADVGLAGFPNAGKSTLLSVISAARPKIADYPFTTLVPNLGVVEFGGRNDYWGDTFVVADVPGLIEGASDGRGLGLDFLKHLERTSVVAFIVDAFGLEHEPVEALAILRTELAKFSPELSSKRSLVVLSKQDLMDAEALAGLRAKFEAQGDEVLVISAATGEGLTPLKHRLLALVREEKARAVEAARVPLIWGEDLRPEA